MQYCMRRSTADRCLDMACEFGGDARISIQDMYREHLHLRAIPTAFAYGDADFMKPAHAQLLIHERTLPHAEVFVVSNSGHHLYFDNPAETLQGLLGSFFRVAER